MLLVSISQHGHGAIYVTADGKTLATTTLQQLLSTHFVAFYSTSGGIKSLEIGQKRARLQYTAITKNTVNADAKSKKRKTIEYNV